MKHENDVSNMVAFLQVVRIYSFVKKIEVYVRVPYIVFLFVKTENHDSIKEVRHVLRTFITWWKLFEANVCEISGASENPWHTDLLSNCPKRSPRFSAG